MENNIKDYRLQNSLALKFFLACFLGINAGGFIELSKGVTKGWHFAWMFTISVITYGLALLMFKKDAQQKNVSKTLIVGFNILYLFLMCTTQKESVFVIAFPIVILVLIFKDKKLFLSQCIAVGISIAVFVGFQIQRGNTEEVTITSISIVLSLAAIYSVAKEMIETSDRAEALAVTSEENNNVLKSLIGELAGISDTVKSNTLELEHTVEEFNTTMQTATGSIQNVAEGATETTKEIERETILIDNIKQKIDTVAESTNNVNSYSNQVKKDITEGLVIVSDLLSKSEKIAEQNTEVNVSMQELVAKSESIASITNVITDIAEQTNLLAINAAIEAARVGEQGKGFAVVAEDIKKLADKSKQNAYDIDRIISEVENETTISVEKVQALYKESEEQQELVNNTSYIFNNIKASIDVVQKEVEQVLEQIKDVLGDSGSLYESVVSDYGIATQTMSSSNNTLVAFDNNVQQLEGLNVALRTIQQTIGEMDKYFN